MTTRRTGAHAGNPGSQGSALDAALEIAEGMRALTERFEADDADTRDPQEHYHFNVGEIRAGEWISSAPTTATLGARVGFPRDMPPADAQEHVREAVAGVDPAAELKFVGFRAEVSRPMTPARRDRCRARTQDDARRHLVTSGGDERRLPRRGIPAVCYGPRGRNLHAVDESVELSSIVAGARTLTRLIPRWLHGGEA